MSAASSRRNGLAARIREALLDPERWRDAVTRNFSLKLLSLLFAFGLWAFVNFGERDTEEALKVPLELRNIPASLVITSPRVDFIDVRVVGPRTLLGRIDRSRLSIPLDLQGVRPGPAVFRVAGESLNMPRGVRVVRINPAVVTLDLERVGRKTVPVQLRFDGEPPKGFKLVSARVSPEAVELTGPAKDVGDIEMVFTSKLSIAEAEAGVIKQSLPLESVGDYLSFSTPRVDVEVRIEEVVVRREISDVPIEIRNASDEASVKPAKTRLTIRGPQRLVTALEPEDLQVYVDVDADAGTGEVKLVADVPVPVELISMEPESVQLTITKAAPATAEPAAAKTTTPRAKK